MALNVSSVLPRLDQFAQLQERAGDVADHFDVRVVILVDLRFDEVDVDDLLVEAPVPDVGRILDDVVPDGDDQVGAVDAAVDVVPPVDAGRIEAVHGRIGEHAFAHLGVHDVDARVLDELHELARDQVPVRARRQDDERVLRAVDQVGRADEGLGIGRGPPDEARLLDLRCRSRSPRRPRAVPRARRRAAPPGRA